MELWSQVMVEWINCLDISETPIRDIKQLETRKCYENLISLMSWNSKDTSDKADVITNFLNDEYPEFKIENKDDDLDSNSLYIGSILLLSASQEPIFHKPMCAKLQHDTQINIKTFLEMVLPYGKDITKEILHKTLARLNNAVPKTPSTTPRTHLLKDFFNTPASRSARSHKRMFEYNRELRHLRSELELERCERADMQEDLEIQQIKIENLQKKLQEKNIEIKRLQEEQIKPSTPQSCKKHKNASNYEGLCRKEIRNLEEELRQQRREMSKVEEEKESISRKLISMERQCTILKEKCASFESSVESLLIQVEYRDRELIGLKVINDELRTHLEEYQKINAPDQSCEFDNSLIPSSPNKGEVLSKVVDLQLQEVKIESDRLKDQLELLTSKMKDIGEENERLVKANDTLQDHVREMKEIAEENERLKEIVMQKDMLENDIAKLRETISVKDKLLMSLSHYAEENTRLKEIAQQKSNLENDMLKLRDNIAAKDKLLTSLSEYIEENARLKETAMQKNVLEQNLIQLRDEVAAKDELLTSVSVSVRDFISNVQTKCEDVFNRLDLSVVRVTKLENMTNKLQGNCQTKIALMNSEILNLKTECKKANGLLHEKKVLKEKLDTARTRNAKLERNLDELRSELKKMKTEHENSSALPDEECLKQQITGLEEKNILWPKKTEHLNTQTDVKDLRREIERLRKENMLLCNKNDDLNKQADIEEFKKEVAYLKQVNDTISKKNEDLSRQLNEVASTDRLQNIHRKYEQKLEEMKVKMKIAHKEQVTKLNEMHNLAVQEKLDNLQTQILQQRLKRNEETNSYKVRISDLEQKMWHTSERLLIEQQQKQEMLQQLNLLRSNLERFHDATRTKSAASIQQNVLVQTELESRCAPLNSTRTMMVIKEEACETEYKMHNVPASGNDTFKTADEKTEVFDNGYLLNLKEGFYSPIHDANRLSILQQRNSLFLPHLKSSYPAEMQYHPIGFNEEEIKNIIATPRQEITGMHQRSRVTDQRQIQ